MPAYPNCRARPSPNRQKPPIANKPIALPVLSRYVAASCGHRGESAALPNGVARWRSGYAEDCKSLHAGSIPARASISRRGIIPRQCAALAQSVEHIIRNDGVRGSNPLSGTTHSRDCQTDGDLLLDRLESAPFCGPCGASLRRQISRPSILLGSNLEAFEICNCDYLGPTLDEQARQFSRESG